MLTIALLCQDFQKRLCWMLSSLVDQKDPPPFRLDVATFKDNGKPTTLSVTEFFLAKGLSVYLREYDDMERMSRRGLVRNDQVKDCRTTWIWFADADHVLHPEYLNRLAKELTRIGPTSHCVSAGRMSMAPWDAEIDASVKDDPVYIEDAFGRASRQVLRGMGKPGIGHTQIAHVASIPDGVYVPDDATWDRAWLTRSDVQFRHRTGQVISLPMWFTKNQIHLNHERNWGTQR